MEVTPFDSRAVRRGPVHRRGVSVVRHVPVVGRDETVRVRRGALHVAQPFARGRPVRVEKAAVVHEHALDARVDPALEDVAGARHGAAGDQGGVEEREQRALPPEPFEPPVAAAQRLVGPPPLLAGCARVAGLVPGHGAFGQQALPPGVSVVELRAPRGRPDRVTHGEERVREPLELPPRLQAGP